MSKKTIALGTLALLCLAAIVSAERVASAKIAEARQKLIPAATTEITFMSDDNYIVVQH